MIKLLKQCLRFTVQKNFLYLISALLVLIGSFQFMVDAGNAGFEEFTSTVALLSVLQLYEILLAGVGYAVYKKLKISHDGLMLTLISLILIFDPTFFNSRLYTCASSIWAGLAVNITLLFLALGKFYFFIQSPHSFWEISVCQMCFGNWTINLYFLEFNRQVLVTG